MLLVFDLDGTLIEATAARRGRSYGAWVPLLGRPERLAADLAAGHRLAIATNQGAIAFGKTTEEDFRAKCAEALAELGLPADTPVAVCFAHPRGTLARYRDPAQCARRKPSGAMLRELAAAYPDDAAAGCLYVGDLPSDQQAAADAGFDFMWSHEYFGL